MQVKHVIIPIFVPHKGCPHDCIFCNQKKISGQVEEMLADKIPEIIESHLSTVPSDAYIEIAFYGGSFTAIDKEVQKSFLEKAAPYITSGRVSEIRLSTRPDAIDDEILELLKMYHVKTIELGVQSMEDDVLNASCRGHNAACVYEASALIRQKGFKLGIQTMTGLPGDTREKSLQTAVKVIGIAPEMVRIYPVLVIKGTELERQYREGRYTPQTLEEAVELCAELLDLYEENGIQVIRIGLQATESIREGDESEVAAGPVHPALRQLVESRRILKKMEAMIEKQELEGIRELVIHAGISDISNVVGQKRQNINRLQSKYRIGSIKVKGDRNISHGFTMHAAE